MVRIQARLSPLIALTETRIRVYTIAKASFSWFNSSFAVRRLASCTGEVRSKTGAIDDADVLSKTPAVSWKRKQLVFTLEDRLLEGKVYLWLV